MIRIMNTKKISKIEDGRIFYEEVIADRDLQKIIYNQEQEIKRLRAILRKKRIKF